jgi:hypothetical protein
MFVRELRKRIDEYFRISVRTLRVYFYIILGNHSKKYWNIFGQEITIVNAILSLQLTLKK